MTDIQSVSLKLSQFWPDGDKYGFSKQYQCAIHSITEKQTKYHHVVTAFHYEISSKYSGGEAVHGSEKLPP